MKNNFSSGDEKLRREFEKIVDLNELKSLNFQDYKELRILIKQLADAVSSRDFDAIVKEDKLGRVEVQDLERILDEYPEAMGALPDEAFEIVEYYEIRGSKNELSIDINMWSDNGERTDLTLRLDAIRINGSYSISISDFLVP